MRLTLHFSGPLLLMWRKHYPGYLERLKRLISRGNIEVLGGSYSEAPLPLLPFEDRVTQLRAGRRLVEELLGVRPKGAWLAERIWDPTLPAALWEAGYQYVVVDDEVGYRIGLSEKDVHRAWLTEYSGRSLGVFFIDARVRYILPWKSPEEVLEYLKKYADAEGSLYVLWGSDAEKFGEWWNASDAEKWLMRFFERLRSNQAVETSTPQRYLASKGYRGLVYLPPGSYDKMQEWSGGYFPNFLRKYRESNNMHKKMLWVRRKISRLGEDHPAYEEYMLGQCNDAYWHGLFGGIYLPFLRQSVYEHLIRAERMAEEALKAENVRIVETDFDYDGETELLLESKRMNAYVKPSDGGSLFELDIKLEGYEHNFQATMSRYMESYLENVSDFRPDWYRRVSFRDHIWREGATINDWTENTPYMDTSDLALGRNTYYVKEDEVHMMFTGKEWSLNKPRLIFVEKTYRLETNGLQVKYRVKNLEKSSVHYLFSTELTFLPRLPEEGVKVGYSINGEYKCIEDTAAVEKANEVSLITEGYPRLIIKSEARAQVWAAPLHSLSMTEKGPRKMFQGLGILFNYPLNLEAGQEFFNTFSVEIEG